MASEVLQKLIKEACRDLRESRAAIDGQIAELQDACAHPNMSKIHKSSTGGYDPSSDAYWTEFNCPDCGKMWSEDGSK